MEYPDLPYVGLENVEPDSMTLLNHSRAGDARSSALRFAAGDILYGKMRPYLNKIWVAEFDGLCSAEFLVFKKQHAISNRFLAKRLNAQDFVEFANAQVSGERPRVAFEKLSGFRIFLPPRTEQDRIVAKLDAALSRTRNAERAARRAQGRLERYRTAVLSAAATGELTRGWRETGETADVLLKRLLAARRELWAQNELKRFPALEKESKGSGRKPRYHDPAAPDIAALPHIPAGWVWTRLQQLGFVTGGLAKSPHRNGLPLKLPYLRVANVYADQLRLDHVESIGVGEQELHRLLLKKGDLLIVEGNGSKDQIGRLAIWDGSVERCVHQNHLIKVRLVEKQLGRWVLTWLLSPPGREHVEKVASSTTGLFTLSLSKVDDLPVPLPSLAEQSSITTQVERRMSAADRLEAAVEQQLTRASSARNSLMTDAFSGRLVSQDPTDEPAARLLDRLSIAGTTNPQRRRGERMPKSRTKSQVIRRPLVEVLRQHGGVMTPEQLFRDSGYQHEFEDNESRQEIVDRFYEELRQHVGTHGPIVEKRPDRNTVLLELKS